MEPNENSQFLLSLPLYFETSLKNFHEAITKCMNDKLDKFKSDIISKINSKKEQKNKIPKKLENINFLINLIFQILSNIRPFVDLIYKKANTNKIKGKTISSCFSSFLTSKNEISKESHDILKSILKEKYYSSEPNIIFKEILDQIIEELKLNFKPSSANNLSDDKNTNCKNSYKYYSDLNNEIFKIFYFVERKKMDELKYEFTANSIHDINLANLKNFEILPLENIDNFRQINSQNNTYKKFQKINNILMINIIRDENKISKIIYLYDENGEKKLDDNNKIFNEQNTAFLIYQKKEN